MQGCTPLAAKFSLLLNGRSGGPPAASSGRKRKKMENKKSQKPESENAEEKVVAGAGGWAAHIGQENATRLKRKTKAENGTMKSSVERAVWLWLESGEACPEKPGREAGETKAALLEKIALLEAALAGAEEKTT